MFKLIGRSGTKIPQRTLPEIDFLLRFSSQPVNGFHVSSLLQSAFLDMVPPLEQEVVHDEPEPRAQFQTTLSSVGFPQQLFQVVAVHVLDSSNFIRVWMDVNISDDEEQVINCDSRKINN